MLTRTWADVFEAFCGRGRESSQDRSRRVAASPAFDAIRDKPLIETTADDFDLAEGQRPGGEQLPALLSQPRSRSRMVVGTCDGKKAWPPLQLRQVKRRGITQDEFSLIIKAERNVERRHYYALLWETGSAQMDAAILTAENIDWEGTTLIYQRQKLREERTLHCLESAQSLPRSSKHSLNLDPCFPPLGKLEAKSVRLSFAGAAACSALGDYAVFSIFVGRESLLRWIPGAFCPSCARSREQGRASRIFAEGEGDLSTTGGFSDSTARTCNRFYARSCGSLTSF